MVNVETNAWTFFLFFSVWESSFVVDIFWSGWLVDVSRHVPAEVLQVIGCKDVVRKEKERSSAAEIRGRVGWCRVELPCFGREGGDDQEWQDKKSRQCNGMAGVIRSAQLSFLGGGREGLVF